MTIVLLGYMGSGKTTISRKLSKILNFNFIDLDELITSKQCMTINEIFKIKGEIFFRKLESNYLKEILNEDQNSVLSLGGGTPCYGSNMEKIQRSENTTSIYLKTGLSTLVERLENEKDRRPLIAHLETKEQLQEFIAKHVFERAQFYIQSDYVINTDDKSIENVMEEIILKLF